MKLIELDDPNNIATPEQYKELGAKLQAKGFQFNKSFFGNKEPGRPLNIRATERSKDELQTALRQVNPAIILQPADTKITGSTRVDGQMFELNGVKYYIGVGMSFGDEGSKITIFGRKALTPTVLGLQSTYINLSSLAEDVKSTIQQKFKSPIRDLLLHILGNARNKKSQIPLTPELAKIMNQQNVFQSVNQDFGEVLGAFVLGKENDKVEFPSGNEALIDLRLPGQEIAIKSLSGSANAFTKVKDLFDKYEETLDVNDSKKLAKFSVIKGFTDKSKSVIDSIIIGSYEAKTPEMAKLMAMTGANRITTQQELITAMESLLLDTNTGKTASYEKFLSIRKQIGSASGKEWGKPRESSSSTGEKAYRQEPILYASKNIVYTLGKGLEHMVLNGVDKESYSSIINDVMKQVNINVGQVSVNKQGIVDIELTAFKDKNFKFDYHAYTTKPGNNRPGFAIAR